MVISYACDERLLVVPCMLPIRRARENRRYSSTECTDGNIGAKGGASLGTRKMCFTVNRLAQMVTKMPVDTTGCFFFPGALLCTNKQTSEIPCCSRSAAKTSEPEPSF